jgi:hypothetical protein
MRRHYFLLLTVALAACHSAGAPAPREAAFDQEIQLAPGERALFGPRKLDVEFVRVVEDSRCPTDVTCVWAGEVKVQLATRSGGAEAVQHELTAGKPAAVGGLQLDVVQVQPERISTREIAAQEYRVTLQARDSNPARRVGESVSY